MIEQTTSPKFLAITLGGGARMELEYWPTGVVNVTLLNVEGVAERRRPIKIKGWMGIKETSQVREFLSSAPVPELWAIFTPGGSHLTECEASSEEGAWNLFLFSQETVPDDDRVTDRQYFKDHAIHRGYVANKISD